MTPGRRWPCAADRLTRSAALLVVVAVCSGLPGVEDATHPESAGPAREYVRKLAARSGKLRSLHVRFRQEKTLRLLRRPRLSEGELWYSGGRLSMVVRRRGTVESHLLMRDGELKILYPRLGRLETLAVGTDGRGGGRETGMAVPFLAGDWDSAEREYELSLRRDKERVVLLLRPRDPDSPVKALRMVMVGDRLKEYSQEEKSGNRMRMEILGWEENGPIPEERFVLEVPDGTKTVPLR